MKCTKYLHSFRDFFLWARTKNISRMFFFFFSDDVVHSLFFFQISSIQFEIFWLPNQVVLRPNSLTLSRRYAVLFDSGKVAFLAGATYPDESNVYSRPPHAFHLQIGQRVFMVLDPRRWLVL